MALVQVSITAAPPSILASIGKAGPWLCHQLRRGCEWALGPLRIPQGCGSWTVRQACDSLLVLCGGTVASLGRPFYCGSCLATPSEMRADGSWQPLPCSGLQTLPSSVREPAGGCAFMCDFVSQCALHRKLFLVTLFWF